MNILLELKSPSIAGESKLAGFENQIQIASYRFGVSRPKLEGSITKTATNLNKHIGPIEFVKSTDQSSPLLFQHACIGTVFGSAVISCIQPDDTVRPGGGQTTPYIVTMKITLQHVHLISWDSQAGAAQATLLDEFSLDYSHIDLHYTRDDGKGNFCGKWDVKSNSCR